ncbi:MAG: hypothetical protein A2Z34_00835 [Planctomycetes bacterium RBG_16_59_8]|nr:MAG: hypothetical protein A2Z34_00835 [Planctomycetes bacterium RBG_16_59_8]
MGGSMNIREIRKDFPLLQRMVYFNSAAVGPNPLPVIRAGERFQRERNFFHPERLPEWLRSLDKVRASVAALIGAKPREIAFTTNTDDGLNIVASGFRRLRKGDAVVSNDLDFPTTHIVWGEMKRRRGIRYVVLPNRGGAVTAEDFAKQLPRRTRLASIALVSNVNGYLHDVRGIADCVHARGAFLFADAVQAVGNIPIDVRAMGIDFLACAAYKWLLGPLGLAFFYIREELLDEVLPLSGGWMQMERFVKPTTGERYTDARKFEYGTLHFQGVAELQAALAYRKRVGFRRTSDHAVGLGLRLQRALDSAGFRLFTPMGNRTPIVTFFADNGYEVAKKMLRRGISVMGRPGNVRVSPNFFNTEEEIDSFVDLLKRER